MSLPPSAIKAHVIRLKPHEDIKSSILSFAKDHRIKAGVILTCVGSLEQYNLRFANEKNGSAVKGYFEILSLTGTLSESYGHFHLSIADNTGKTFGGHLLDENLVYTTAEIAIAELTNFIFERKADPSYGYHELIVKSLKK